MKSIGLRFASKDAARLRLIAHRIRIGDYANRTQAGRGVDLYDKAAKCAEAGIPLIVHCEDAVEAVAIADAFPTLGVTRPAVEAMAS